jgi:hypothetical protein
VFHSLLVALALVAAPTTVAQDTTAGPLDWSAEDSTRVRFVTAHGTAQRHHQLVIWAPTDSVDAGWLAAFGDTLDKGLRDLRALVGGPYSWQRIGNRPVVFFFSPGRFVSHATGRDTVFISLNRIRRGEAPFLHEASHELLTPRGPFFADEYPDGGEQERRAAQFPQWLSEGLPDYLAQSVAKATGFPEGDVFEVGGLDKVDSSCAVRLANSARRDEILTKIGGQGRLGALFTEDREVVAPTYYACSQSFTKYLVDRIGVKAVLGLFPEIPAGTWNGKVEQLAGEPIAALRRKWMDQLGIR